jgi:uncharacterized protein YjbJ (UPF0337 family)
MDKDTAKGNMKDIAGRVERQAGEWTGDKDLQTEGAKDQAEGKAQNMWGKVKDKARDVKDDMQERKAKHDIKKDEAA